MTDAKDCFLEFERPDLSISETAGASSASGEASPPPIRPEKPRPLTSLVVSTIAVGALVVGAALGGRLLAAIVAGMSSLEFHRDLIVATSAIIIHLSLDRFIHRVSGAMRTLRTGTSKRDQHPLD